MKSLYYVVTNGLEYGYWNSGHWDSTDEFAGVCLLDDDDMRDALRDLNKGNEEDALPWVSKEAWVEIEP